MSKGNPIACFVCGGSYTADQRRRHEQTAKHQDALAPAVEANVKSINGGTHVIELEDATAQQIAESQKPVEMPKRTYTVADGKLFPATADEIDRLMKVVKGREADVRWSSNPKHGDSAEKLAKRRQRLADAQTNLDAALMSIPESN